MILGGAHFLFLTFERNRQLVSSYGMAGGKEAVWMTCRWNGCDGWGTYFSADR